MKTADRAAATARSAVTVPSPGLTYALPPGGMSARCARVSISERMGIACMNLPFGLWSCDLRRVLGPALHVWCAMEDHA